MTAEEKLKERYEAFEYSSVLDVTDGRDVNMITHPTIWASISPEDIDLIAELVVERLKSGIELANKLIDEKVEVDRKQQEEAQEKYDRDGIVPPGYKLEPDGYYGY